MLHTRVLIALALAVITFSPVRAQAESETRLYAGIELGGKGIKVIEVKVHISGSQIRFERPDIKDYNKDKLVPGQTINTTLSSIDAKSKDIKAEAIDDAIAAVENCLDYVKAKGVKKGHVFLVASSGVPNTPGREKLKERIKAKFGRNLDYIKTEDEAGLLITGLLTKEQRKDAIVVDIGSGNIKLVMLDDKTGWLVVAKDKRLPGTVEFTTELKKIFGAQGFAADTLKQKRTLIDGSLKLLLHMPVESKAENYVFFKGSKQIYLTGGAVWAMCVFQQPKAMAMAKSKRPDFIELNQSDIDDFHKLVSRDPANYPKPSTVGLNLSDDEKMTLEEEYLAVRGTFGKENLFAAR